ncbi:protein crumbs-like [Littorina saxatilis]|uniref:protein crumbs-like n=1 Tax=Littorina saxatilis TaxID=31220 RepID=UPI0038B4B2F2
MEKEAVICAVLVFVTASAVLAVCDATDVYLNCPADQWVIGNPVTIHCSALKTAYPSQCTSINREVEFRRSPNGASYSTRCAMDDVENTCTPSSSDCKCSNSNSTHFNFQYTFSVAADSSGYWECYVPCLNGITNQLTYSASAACNDRNVTSGPCDGVNCKNLGTCYVDDNNQAKCNCSGTNYKGDFCETHICDGKDCNQGKCYVDGVTATCDCTGMSGGDDCSELDPVLIALICVSTLLGLLMAANGAGVYRGKKQRSGGQPNALPDNAPQVNAPQVNDPRYNTPPANAPPDDAPQVNDPRYNTPPDNAPQVAGSAEPSTGHTVPTTPYDEPCDSEASEGTEYSASEVSGV